MQRQIKTKRPVRFSDDGLTVFITLPSGDAAMIDRSVYEGFVREGMSLNWYTTQDRHGNRYVHVHDSRVGNIVTVSRQIMRAGKGEVISFYNGNRLDLRRGNLRRGKGPARRALDFIGDAETAGLPPRALTVGGGWQWLNINNLKGASSPQQVAEILTAAVAGYKQKFPTESDEDITIAHDAKTGIMIMVDSLLGLPRPHARPMRWEEILSNFRTRSTSLHRKAA